MFPLESKFWKVYEIVYLYLWRPQLLICKGDEWDFPGFSIQMRGFFWRILIFKQHHASRNWIVHLLDLYVSTSTPTILGILEITILCNGPLAYVFLKSFNRLGFTRVWFGYFEVLKNGVVNLRYLYSSISSKTWKTFYLFSRRLWVSMNHVLQLYINATHFGLLNAMYKAL